MAREPHPEIKRALGAGEKSASEAADHAERARKLLGKPRKKEPSLADISDKLEKLQEDADDWKEDSKVIRARLEDQNNEPSAALSMALPGGFHLSARGGKAILAAVVIALLVAVWFAGRATAQRHERPSEAPATK